MVGKGRGFLNSFAIKIPKFKLRKFSIPEGLFLFVLLSFVVGYVIGVVSATKSGGTLFNIAKNLFEQNVTQKDTYSFIKYTFNSFISFLPYLLLAYFSGTSAFGCIAIPIICIARGISNGILTAYIYSTYNLVGIGYTAFVLAPYFVFSAYILILACRESFCYSERMLKNTLPKGTSINFFNDYKLYTVRYLIILLLGVLSAFLDASLTNVFYKYFNF